MGARRIRRPRRPHGLILMYHRVADMIADPWNIAVSPANFAGHMEALADFADVVPLTGLPAQLRRGRRSRAAVAVTFDDGYVDNLIHAKPVLDSLDAPATVFVPTGWVGDPRPLWWERLSHAVFAGGPLPEAQDFLHEGVDFSWRDPALGAADRAGQQARSRIHRALWTRMRQLPDDDARHRMLDALTVLLGTDEAPIADARVMTAEEVRRLARDGRVDIGSHSVTHPTLPALTREQKAWEIERSADECRELVGRRPTTFAYPYGDVDAECVEIARDAGYEVACSIREDLVWAGDDPHLLPRIAVGNWSAAEFRVRLTRYWLA
jgi:peptidoglycan/xylan/chitin deacetylase (PgdA/CDA1 family)